MSAAQLTIWLACSDTHFVIFGHEKGACQNHQHCCLCCLCWKLHVHAKADAEPPLQHVAQAECRIKQSVLPVYASLSATNVLPLRDIKYALTRTCI